MYFTFVFTIYIAQTIYILILGKLKYQTLKNIQYSYFLQHPLQLQQHCLHLKHLLTDTVGGPCKLHLGGGQGRGVKAFFEY